MSKSRNTKKRSIKPIIIGFSVALLIMAMAAYQMMSANRKPTSIQDEDWDVDSAVYDSAGGMDGDLDIDEKIEEPVKPDMGAADPTDSDADDHDDAHDTEQWKANSGPLKGKAR